MTKRVFSGYGSHSIVVDFILSRKTGTLVFFPGGRKLFFDKGNLVFAGSEIGAEHFSEILVRNGVLSHESLHDIRAGLKKGESLGRILKNRGFATPRQLARALKQQISSIMAGVFDLDGGECQVLENILPERLPKLRIQTLTLVIQSITHSSTPEQIAAFSPEGSFHTTPNFEKVRAAFELPAIYHAFIDFVVHSETICSDTLTKEFAYHPLLIKRLLYFLYIMGMILPLREERTSNEDDIGLPSKSPRVGAEKRGQEPNPEDTLPTSESQRVIEAARELNHSPSEGEPDFALDGDATLGERALSVDVETGPSVGLDEGNGPLSTAPERASRVKAEHILEGPVHELESALQKIETEGKWQTAEPGFDKGASAQAPNRNLAENVILYEPEKQEPVAPPRPKTNRKRNTILSVAALVILILLVILLLPTHLLDTFRLSGKETHTTRSPTPTVDLDPPPAEANLSEDSRSSDENEADDPLPSETTVLESVLGAPAENPSDSPENESEAEMPVRLMEVPDWSGGDYPSLVERSRERMRQQKGEYSIALIVACEKETLDDIFNEYRGKNLFLFDRKINSRNCYLLSWGSFPTRERAIAARGDTPAYFKQWDGGPGWIVNLAGQL